tara:strand:- start:1484 stop:2014 length:531 start_codon:yes stop_codon:yes gene_type:complete
MMATAPVNPATTPVARNTERKRIPMSVPVQKLEVADLPGYHMHWFKSEPDRIERALNGGYEFVDEKEVKVNNVSLGGTSAVSGNTDLGSRVSIVSGAEFGKDGQPMRLVLMKIKQEWYEEDQKLVDQRNQRTINSLTSGMIGADGAADARDSQHRYVDKNRSSIPDFFKPKRPQAA